MIPFMAEDIYRNLVCSIDKNAPESIHLCDFPIFDESFIDEKLEDDMQKVLDVVVLARAARNASNIKNRQPIGDMFIKSDFTLDDENISIIKDEINVKNVEFTQNVDKCVTYTFKPQLKTVGPKYGKYLGQIKEALLSLDGNEAMSTLNETGSLKFTFDGFEVVLEKEDLLIEEAKVEGFSTQSDKGITVVLDTNLTDELICEGFVREIISKIQSMRKDSDFEVMDHINVYVSGNDKIAGIMQKNAEFIKEEVLAEAILTEDFSGMKEWNINGENVQLGVERI